MSAIIEVEIGPGASPGTYDARVIRSAGGPLARRNFSLEVGAMLDRLPTVEAVVLASAVSARRIMTANESEIHRLGGELFTSVFAGEVGTAFRSGQAVARERATSLQVRLRLTDPALAALPWEAMFDPIDGVYVCRKEPLIRYVETPTSNEALQVDPPLRILGIISTPRDLPRIDAASERARLERALSTHLAAGRVIIDWLEEATWANVHEKLLSGRWHVLHYVGHGDYDRAGGEGVLALVDHDGRAEYVDASVFADLIDEAEPTPRLIVLNSCASGASGETELFAGTASALVRSGIRAVAAMQFTISDVAALEFSRGFYSALANGRGVDEAVRSGRIAILGLGRYTLEWVTPVLYLAGDDARLFDIAATAVPALGAAPPSPSVDREPDSEPQPESLPPPEPEAEPEPEPEQIRDEPEAEPEPEPQRPPEPAALLEADSPSEPEATLLQGADVEPRSGSGSRSGSRASRRGLLIPITAGSIALVGIVVAVVIALSNSRSSGGYGESAAPAEPSPPTTFTVPAAIPWTATGIECSAGDTLEITATGTVTDEADATTQVTPDGLPGTAGREANLPALPEADALALIGRVGETQPFFVIGSDFTGICPSDGPLSVGLNDTEPSGNGGTFEVTTTVTPSLHGNTWVEPVPGDSTWSSFSLNCDPGDEVHFVASGRIALGGAPDRIAGPEGTSDDAGLNVPGLETAPHGALIGRFGEGPPFLIGSSSSVACPGDSAYWIDLGLGINDAGADVAYNIGAFTVAVVPVAEADSASTD